MGMGIGNKERVVVTKRVYSTISGFFSWGFLGLSLTGIQPIYAADVGKWNLEASVQRVLEVAPEVRGMEAEVKAREGALRQAGIWPNPSIALRADNALGKEDDSGGYAMTQLTLSQPLPLLRLPAQIKAAQARLTGALETGRYKRLLLEFETARVFHDLQLAREKFDITQQRLRAAVELVGKDSKNRGADPLVRYLTPLERLRLRILRETAQQSVATAEGKLSEAVAKFRVFLALAPDTNPEPMALTPAREPASLAKLQEILNKHPALIAAQREYDAATAEMDAARARRFNDPELILFQERAYLNNHRQNVTGLGIAVPLPFWNQNSGAIQEAQAQIPKAQAQLAVQQRDLENALRQSYIHLNHLIEQAARFRSGLLEPAQTAYDLTRRGFVAGEVNVLALIDANNTHFDARERYLELLRDAWFEVASLRLATGISLRDTPAEKKDEKKGEKKP